MALFVLQTLKACTAKLEKYFSLGGEERLAEISFYYN
jgi:hypothetical protein